MKSTSPQSGKGNSLWLFLNSQFGLWLLSAVLLTGAASIYTKYQESVSKERTEAKELATRERQRVLTIERLDFEIAFRISAILQRLSEINDGKFLFHDRTLVVVTKQNRRELIVATIALLKDREPPTATLYPEYSKLGLAALYAELYRNLEPEQKRSLEPYIAEIAGNRFDRVDIENAEAVGKVIQASLIAPRWRNNRFHYLDCPPEAPFC